jgi:putative flavoprotein involved in K+ transport
MNSVYDTLVIGAGQAGLAAGYYLQRAGLRFALLDAGEEIGAAWKDRWDSLRLFTPARYSSLPGMRFPGEPYSLPTKKRGRGIPEDVRAAFLAPSALTHQGEPPTLRRPELPSDHRRR